MSLLNLPVFKLINILITDQMILTNVKGVCHCDEHTDIYHLTLQLSSTHFSVFQLIILLLWFQCFSSPSPLSSTLE